MWYGGVDLLNVDSGDKLLVKKGSVFEGFVVSNVSFGMLGVVNDWFKRVGFFIIGSGFNFVGRKGVGLFLCICILVKISILWVICNINIKYIDIIKMDYNIGSFLFVYCFDIILDY